MAHPSAMSGGLHGPFTHWYPGGGVESHGDYVEEGATSVPDGVWGFWYPDGSRKSVGRYERGRPVGCFSMWDEQGGEVTGVVEGDQLRVEQCEPPADEALVQVEGRSNPRANRSRWGDVTIHALAQAGTFGASNTTQYDSDPSARGSVQAALRKYLGSIRVGTALGMRLSDTRNARAYSGGVVAAAAAPLPYRRIGAELEVQLGVQYLDVTATRPELPGSASVGFWAPLGSARLAMSFALTPTVLVVGGASVEGAPVREVDRVVRYCAPLCSPPVMESWNIGGAAYGIDVGLRLMLR